MKKLMKLLCIILCVTLCMSIFVACSSDNDDKDTDKENEEQNSDVDDDELKVEIDNYYGEYKLDAIVEVAVTVSTEGKITGVEIKDCCTTYNLSTLSEDYLTCFNGVVVTDFSCTDEAFVDSKDTVASKAVTEAVEIALGKIDDESVEEQTVSGKYTISSKVEVKVSIADGVITAVVLDDCCTTYDVSALSDEFYDVFTDVVVSEFDCTDEKFSDSENVAASKAVTEAVEAAIEKCTTC